MKINTATDLVKLALVGGVAYVGYRALSTLGQMPSVTETANNAYWQSSLGDLTAYGLDWYTNGWGWEPLSPEQAAQAEQAAQDMNEGVGWSPTTGGAW